MSLKRLKVILSNIYDIEKCIFHEKKNEWHPNGEINALALQIMVLLTLKIHLKIDQMT